MEIYTLDSLLRREEVVDRFESLIWTERFNSIGDFELEIWSTHESRSLFKTGTLLALDQSKRVMVVTTTEDRHTSDGRRILEVKGYSLEILLEDRAAYPQMTSLTTIPVWELNGAPVDVCNFVFDEICRSGKLNIGDKIPFLMPGTIMPASTIPAPLDPINLKVEPKSVYSIIKEIADAWNLGFRLLRNGDLSQLYFDVYTGHDRTSGQTARPSVIFAPELDNLQDMKELNTIEGAKNAAYVFSPAGSTMVYPIDVDPEVEGFERHVLVVKADDITTSLANPQAAMEERGREELAKHRAFSAFDGEINQGSQYRYGVHYELGDIVEVRNGDGVGNHMRVTEQIFVSDKQGVRSYPTLTINTFVNTGSWLSWASNKRWLDYETDTTTTWATLP